MVRLLAVKLIWMLHLHAGSGAVLWIPISRVHGNFRVEIRRLCEGTTGLSRVWLLAFGLTWMLHLLAGSGAVLIWEYLGIPGSRVHGNFRIEIRRLCERTTGLPMVRLLAVKLIWMLHLHAGSGAVLWIPISRVHGNFRVEIRRLCEGTTGLPRVWLLTAFIPLGRR